MCQNLESIWPTVPELLMVLYTPCSCSCSDTHCQQCLPLPLHLLHLICHPWPTKCHFLYHSLHTTGLLVTRCKSFTYSSTSLRLGPEFARSRLRKNLITYTASWAKRAMLPWTDGYQQMKHTSMTHEVLRLHREHVRWWDLLMSPCLWAGRHHKEVWQIHQWASRLDMPTHLQGTNWQWQWCCDRVWSSMQADSGDPRCQHQAVQTTSEGQPWQEAIASTRDLQNILHCWIRSSCNVCRSCGTCCMPHPPDTWSKATDVICTMPQLHLSTPSR